MKFTRHLCCFILSLVWAFQGGIYAQNLVPNAGFESYSACPVFASQLDSAVPWFNPTAGTPEFYHACAAYSSGVSVPQQYTGGFQYARSGSGYAGLYTYNNYVADMREYAEIQLISPLVTGICYYFEMYVNVPNNFSLASDGIGALFVQGALHANSAKVIPQSPQIENPVGNVLTDTAGWTKIAGYFTADGGEDHLIIGNFRDDDHTITTVVNPNCWYLHAAYLLIDDVLLQPVEGTLELGSDTLVCHGSQLVLSTGNFGTSWLWSNGSVQPELIVNQEGIYWAEAFLGTCSFRDTIRITYLYPPPVQLPEDTSLCPGDVLILKAGVWQAEYLWSDLSKDPELVVTQPGLYWVKVSNICGANADTIRVSSGDCICIVHIPNVFTPNADQFNDTFKPQINCRLTDYHLSIFNRWGRLVFSTDQPDLGWNGQIQSNTASSGTYFWRLTYSGNTNGKSITYTRNGALTLIR